jgi:hypothetical protein
MMCSRNDDPTQHDAGRPGWAYHLSDGTPLIGPCADERCLYQSLPGGGDHAGPHSWQYPYDGRDGSIEADDGMDDDDRIAEMDAAAREELRDLAEWQRGLRDW